MTQQSLSYIVTPGFLPSVEHSDEAAKTAPWKITNLQHEDIEKVVIDISELSGKSVNLYYELDSGSFDSGCSSVITVRYLLMHKTTLTIK
ncbi:hypothetical protein CEX98_19695 [Pseudoalteromonas piscicida]|uniref:Uncharacterized protein n=1 Tax=Pseudoalteromonas piscicida TaxID=43662 RepID=A0A2A5JKQ7_PSEO7|nr:hypothetical protein CEX98_19695 [Pseudoalteromonas piscicida]